MKFEDSIDNLIYERIKKQLKGRSLHCARNAVHCLEKASEIAEIDPEMAIFRSLTAEEEASTAIFFILKQIGYENAKKINFRSHVHKQAVIPFIRSIGKMLGTLAEKTKYPFGQNYNISLDESDDSSNLLINLPWGKGQLTPHPPLNFSIKENGQPYDFRKELEEIINSKGYSLVIKYLDENANRRNQLIYANEQGIPSLSSDPDKFINSQKCKVAILLRVLALIYPYKDKVLFVQQAINAYLMMLGRIDKEMINSM